ncbi:MAG: energy-coupled thiamine transporter ThiT [Actinomycetia bacterium]|nr:energy-coupled thiamine transporter ThiT [Actinomycetes bacterium]
MSTSGNSSRIHMIAVAGLCIALFAVLDYFKIRLPYNIAGGTISLSMTAIVLFALLYGPGWGMVTGALCGLIDLMLEPYIVAPFQVVLDYPLAFACVGLAGLLAPLAWRLIARGKRILVAGVALAAALAGALFRLVPHFISGVAFFASNAPAGQNVALYSLVYNLSYLIPAAVACGLILALVAPVILPLVRGERVHG